jgi:AbrB family looped-hinge helix DNA binding protein
LILPHLTSKPMETTETTRLSSKGQIILPKTVRDEHHWTPGTDFTVEDTGDGVLLRPIKTGQPTRLDDLVGSLRVNGPARSIEEMDAAIDAELRDRRGRGRY